MATYNPFSQRLEESGLSVSNGTAFDQVEAQIAALQAAIADLELTKAESTVAGVYDIGASGIRLFNDNQTLYFQIDVSGALGAESIDVIQPGGAL